jgi:SAM-dependent methyltransferase
MPTTTTASDLVAKNSAFYDALWTRTYLTSPRRFNTWPLMAALLPVSPRRLEVGPGLRPRLPIAGTHFLDLSAPAVARLNGGGGLARCGQITALPYADGDFDLVVACDVIEHVEDDSLVFGELSRVLEEGGRLVFSVPLHPASWNEFDDYVGHARRYVPAALSALLVGHGLVVERSAVFGMQSNNPRVLRFAVKGLSEHRAIAIRCYNWLFLPLGMFLQKRLKWADGLVAPVGVDEIVVVCRRVGRAGAGESTTISRVADEGLTRPRAIA